MAKSKAADTDNLPPYKAVRIDALVPNARNSRTHSDAQIAQIAASITEFGFTNPVLIDDAGGVIAGHGRLLAARQLGMDKVPCIELSHLTPAQRRAYIIADNKLALNAGWDNDILKIELQELAGAGFDMELIGFSDVEMQSALGLVNEEEAQSKLDCTYTYSLVVECDSEEHQASLLGRLEDQGLKCRLLIS